MIGLIGILHLTVAFMLFLVYIWWYTFRASVEEVFRPKSAYFLAIFWPLTIPTIIVAAVVATFSQKIIDPIVKKIRDIRRKRLEEELR